jgi:hypothetical protein
MDLNLQPLAQNCFLTGRPFVEGERVASYLVQHASAPEIGRYDLLESGTAAFEPPGIVVCRWIHAFKPRRAGESADHVMKLTAENLFVTLADPLTEPTEENVRLLQFLALMLERKKILRPKGRTANGDKNLYEHARSKQRFEIPSGEMTPDFFLRVQEQLSLLMGPPKEKKPAQPAIAASGSTAPPSDEL